MDFEREIDPLEYTRLQSERHNDVLVLSEICQACMNFALIFSHVWCPISHWEAELIRHVNQSVHERPGGFNRLNLMSN